MKPIAEILPGHVLANGVAVESVAEGGSHRTCVADRQVARPGRAGLQEARRFDGRRQKLLAVFVREGGAGVLFRLRAYDEVSSTNAIVKRAIEEGSPRVLRSAPAPKPRATVARGGRGRARMAARTSRSCCARGARLRSFPRSAWSRALR